MVNTRKALVGAAVGAIVGTLAAVVYDRVEQSRSGVARAYSDDMPSLDVQTVASTVLHVLGTIRQILSVA